MNNENKYQFINNLSKEYSRIFWDIMISAESDKELGVRFHKSECKLIMRYLYKKDKEIERLNNIINGMEKLINEYELGKYDYSIPVFILKDKLKELKESDNNE